MSKLADYSKFDHIDENENNSEGEEEVSSDKRQTVSSSSGAAPSAHLNPQGIQTNAAISSLGQNPSSSSGASMRKSDKKGRYVYEYNGQPIYEWEQTLEEVILYIPAPPVHSKDIHCEIMSRRLQLGIVQAIKEKGIYFINEETFGLVEVSESTWTVEDGQIVVYLAKASKGEVWDVALKGKEAASLDPFARQEVQKEMMLERFQEENPGMDFRGAQFNGNVPHPRTFMGGVKYS